MDVTAIQHELELLPANQQDRLAAFLTLLRMKREGMMPELQRRLDEKEPGKWISWDDARSELGIDDSESAE
ncbi:hypothetical protein [Haloferula sp. A504]|uniref:hypothetical protein n=1 Tax=Haloferula sp. A504 TaxID=3373601 RepID=UPI0031C5C646|nr:hypothetical protein [Verrucomicrobiaceae bacterium E54]